jgi:hypothetical protein
MEEQKKKTLERTELYEQVWSKPMIKLAEDYGLSDNGLRKICKKLSIPVPKSGHWQRVQYGKKVKREPLPPFNGQTTATIQRPTKKEKIPKDEPPEILAEYLPSNRIRVPTSISKYHPLVADLKASLSDSWKYRGFKTGKGHTLDVRVSAASVNRALRIMDTLIKALEARSMEVFINSDDRSDTQVRFQGKALSINLHERMQMKRGEKDRFGYSDYEYIPTGELILQIDKSGYGPRCKDGKNKKLEDALNDFIIKIYRRVFEQKAWELEWERRRKEEEERVRQAEEIKRKQELERQKIQALERDAINWQKSQIIRSYVEASKQAYVAKNGEIKSGSEFDQWVAWASQEAGRLNPLKDWPTKH